MAYTQAITLNDGHAVPQLGFGVFKARPEDTAAAVATALACGYRHIDTAKAYNNEEAVGAGMKASGLPREEIFLTTKLWDEDVMKRRPRAGLEASLRRLGTDYVDLYLIHWPVDGYVEAFAELVKLRDEGLIRSAGVCNCNQHHLDALLHAGDVPPAVDQIECHAYFPQQDLVTFCQRQGIAVEAWAPLGGENSHGELLRDPVVRQIAFKHARTPAQVLLCWQRARGVIVLPKSVHRERIEANARIFDWDLDDDDRRQLATLNRGHRLGLDPETRTPCPVLPR